MSGTITIDTLKSGTNKQVSVDEIWHSSNDGSGSGLDADLLDGQDGAYYRNATNINAGTLDKARLPASIDANTSGNANTATNATDHINNQGAVHGATSVNAPGKLVIRDGNGDIGARNFVGNLLGVASSARVVSDTAPPGEGRDLVYGTVAGNDYFRLRISAPGTDDSEVELATADNGNEPIHVRQYTGVFTSAVRTLTLLNGNGNTVIPGNLYLYGGTALVEYGSNENGEYYRFADGTQICSRAVSASAQHPVEHAFAAAFVTVPITIISNDSASAAYASSMNVVTWKFAFFSSTTSHSVRVIAIGRWK